MNSGPSNVVELLSDLIRIPSVNPDGDPGTDKLGEQACAEYVADFLRESCGAETVLEEVLPGRPNVIGRFPNETGAEKCLLFGPHTDTVGVGGMTIDPWSGEVRDGRIWGRGASDTKGSMSTMLWALHELRGEIAKLPFRVMFVGFMGEESRQDGSQHFGKHHADEADFAIAGEPTELDVVFAHKACWWIELITKGKAAHGATPEKGVNAVMKMTHVVQALESEFPAAIAEFEDDVLGLSTVSVNQFHGGGRTNVVPDSCVATIDLRATPGLFARGILEFIREFLDSRGFNEVELNPTCQSPAMRTDREDPFVQQLLANGSKLVTAPWLCDGAWLAHSGIPSIALGPGSIAQAHTKDEFISVEDLEAGAAYFKRFLSAQLP
ncbi:MAG: succinyl-diaminopimelate desuccinylase [Verrucomicrobiales bacterium]|jgi:succinyl-diaminopimelate desuccinylase